MNAYELADQLDNVKYQNGAKPFEMYATMLRQQADRIAELEKFNKAILKKGGYPHKPLSDEEILNEWLGNDRNFYYFARAIEERHGLK